MKAWARQLFQAINSALDVLPWYWALKDNLLRPLLRHDTLRYRTFLPTFNRWLVDLASSPALDENVPMRRVLIVAMCPVWYEMCLAIAIVLLKRNCQVDYVWLRRYGFDHAGSDTPAEKRAFAYRFSDVFHGRQERRLRFILAEDQPLSDLDSNMLEEVKAQSKLDTQYASKIEEIDIEGREKDIYRERIRRNLRFMGQLLAIVKCANYDSAIIPSGGVVEFGVAARLMNLLHIPLVTFEFDGRRNRVWASKGNTPVINLDIQNLWEADEPHILNDERRQCVADLIKSRENPENSDYYYKIQKEHKRTINELYEGLNLRSDKPVVLICPNVAFDAPFLGLSGIFRSGTQWLLETVRHLAKKPECQVIIRSHPAELYYKAEQTSRATIIQAIGSLPNHIRIIPPDVPINTYSLMDLADVGIVFASTTGLEMALRGIPVLCGNRVHYNGKGFTLDSSSMEEYFVTLGKLIESPKLYRLTKRQMELAWCYVDLWLNTWPKPFPWILPTLFQDLRWWPVSRVLSREGQDLFGSTFDFLAGRSQPKT